MWGKWLLCSRKTDHKKAESMKSRTASVEPLRKEAKKLMIYIDRITNICTPDYDEVWWIVHSPDCLPQKEKLVQSLAPSRELFLKYREAFHAGQFGSEFFQTIYVPQFITELSKNKEAEANLDYLCRESSRKNIVLGCYCEDEALCHRSIIAGILLGMGAEIQTNQEYRKYYKMFQKYF